MGAPDERWTDYRGTLPRSSAELEAWHALAAPAVVVEPDLPIVDAHHHLFGGASARLHYRLDEVARDLGGGHRVLGSVYCEAYGAGWREVGPAELRPIGEVESIVRLTAEPLALPQGPCAVAAGVVGHVDMRLGERASDVVAAAVDAGCGRLRGIRHRTATDAGTVGRYIVEAPTPGLLADRTFQRGVATLARHDLSFDVWAYHHQLHELVALADAVPEVTFVLNHIGGPIGVAEFREQRSEVLSTWRASLGSLARRPNVVVKIGGMGMTVFGFGFEHGDRPATTAALADAWHPFIETALAIFGAERCMLESNFPVDKQSCGYVELWNALKLATRTLAPVERASLFYRTACRVYRLPELERLADAATAPSRMETP